MARIRKSGLDFLGDIAWGTHMCQFYQTKQDLIDILVPYFIDGLRDNELCIWVTSDFLNTKEAINAMEKALPDFSKYLQKGQMEIFPYTDWYLKKGKFELGRVLKAWVEKHDKALSLGYAGIRVTGNPFWIDNKKDWDDFTAYEAEINNVIDDYKMLVLCTYSLDKCKANEVIDVVTNHEFTMLKRSGRWGLIESSEHKKIESALRKSEKKFFDLYSSMTEGVALHQIVYDNSGKAIDYVISDVNPSFERITGLFKDEVAGKKASEIYGTGNPPYLDIYAEVAASGNAVSFETYFRPMEKHFSISCVSPSKGKFTTIFHDITERKKVENALASAKAEWERTFDSVPDLIAILDDTHRIVRVNRAMAEKLGKKPEQCVGLNCYEYVHGSAFPHELCPHTQTLKDGKLHTAELHEDRLGGDFLVSTTPLMDEKCRMIGSVHVARDITERKKSENAIKESESRLNLSQEIAHLGSWELDLQTNKLSWSDEVYRIFGFEPQEFGATYQAFLSFVHPDDRLAVDSAYSGSLAEGKDSYEIEHKVIRKDTGKVRIVHEKCNHIRDSTGNIVRSVGMVQDITERKEMEAKLQEYARDLERLVEERTNQLRGAERLAAIGATAGMVGHDIRNPLQSIIGELYLEKESINSLPDNEAKSNLIESLEVIEHNVEYINKIIADLQDFARTPSPTIEKVDFSKLIDNLLSELKAPANVQVITSIQPTFPKLNTDNAAMKRILTNLCTNALQAMPQGGKLTIKANTEDDNVFITVQDTGTGISPDVKEKIFTPLFTTKSKGQGFGLAVVKKLTQALKGEVNVESEVGKGTKFIIKLPL